LLFSDTSTLGLIEDQRRRAVVDMRISVDTVVILVAHIWIFVIEEAIGSVTAWVQPRLWLLDIFSVSTVNIERIITKLVVGVGSFEKQTIGTELFLRNLPDTLVIFITLFRIGEKSVRFRTQELTL